MSDYIYIMYKGRFVESGTKKDIYENAQHIYTQRLLSAIPDVTPVGRDKRKEERKVVENHYQHHHQQYFDENGKVFDLQPISDSQFVAATASTQKGGN